MKRLAVYHDHCSRDNAICYVDGQIYEGRDHYEILDCNFEETEDIDMDDFERNHDVAFAHKVNNEKAIYLETNSMTGNSSPEEVVIALKRTYPGYTIYNDDDESADKIAKVIIADAYDWVSERADHIRDKNPDIAEGEEYGIAWKQYKKKNPGWKSKKQKEKKKKAASRLRYAWSSGTLDNKQDDNANIYYQIDDLMADIRTQLDNVFQVDNYFTEVATIHDAIDSVSANASAINDCAKDAKENGIHNEDQLSIGKDQINDLERDLKELESDLEDIRSENEDLQSDVDSVEAEIDAVRSELNRLTQELTASEQRGMIHEEGNHTWICHAHDAIMGSADEIIDKCDQVRNNVDEAISKADGSNDEEVSEEICDCANDLQSDVEVILKQIERDMQESRDMNNKMGNGIESKNERIEELSGEISEKQDELSYVESDNSNLKSQLADLKSILSQIENELSNIG